MTILYRHSILEKDGIDSSPEIPKLIREFFFIISPDTQHDRSFTQYCQKQISANVTTYMYARMDGWLFFSVVTKLLYATFTKLLAKGPQDAGGGFFKNQADIAVLRRKTKIQCAKDFYNFCTNNLQNPKSGMYNAAYLDI